ncbi:hypothetical protein B0H10DRAFT_2029753 [Mycena sp. CBHHK59/15]|nr:hypothetical protein B0H10DRAFT_2029753 [Mycena sp. CBHHK59/15]
MSTTRPQTRTAAAKAMEERLRALPLGRLLLELGTDILDLQSLFPPAELSAMADDKNHPIYAGLSCLQNGEMHDTMCMPHEGPEVAKIKRNTIPTTNFAIRQYPLPIGSHRGEEDRQAFLLDFYDLRRNSQLKEVPNGYTFKAMSVKTGPVGKRAAAEPEVENVMKTDVDARMEMQPIMLGPNGTTIAVRGVQFEVKRGDEMLLQFTAQE